MNETVGVILDNLNSEKSQDKDLEYLVKYIKQEDIYGLSNPGVLEEILKNVENSVFPENSHSKYFKNPFVSVLFPLQSHIKSLATLFLPARASIRLRICTAMPAFFIFLIITSPYGAFIVDEKAITRQYIENPVKYIKPSIVENLTTLNLKKSAAVPEEIPSSTPAENKSVSSPTPAVSSYSANLSSTGKKADPSPGAVKKNITPPTPALPQNKAPALSTSSISRSDQQRIELSDIIKTSKKKLNMKATAYDLSIKSCQKPPDHPAYGITHTGTRASAGRTIAVDPSVIPLKSKVYISFPEEYKYLNGIYFAEDTGSLIKGYKIDVFFGEDKPGEKTIYDKAKKFGIQNVEVYILG